MQKKSQSVCPHKERTDPRRNSVLAFYSDMFRRVTHKKDTFNSFLLVIYNIFPGLYNHKYMRFDKKAELMFISSILKNFNNIASF